MRLSSASTSWVSGFRLRISIFDLRFRGVGFRVSKYGTQFPGFGFPILRFGFRVSNSEIRVSDYLNAALLRLETVPYFPSEASCLGPYGTPRGGGIIFS